MRPNYLLDPIAKTPSPTTWRQSWWDECRSNPQASTLDLEADTQPSTLDNPQPSPILNSQPPTLDLEAELVGRVALHGRDDGRDSVQLRDPLLPIAFGG